MFLTSSTEEYQASRLDGGRGEEEDKLVEDCPDDVAVSEISTIDRDVQLKGLNDSRSTKCDESDASAGEKDLDCKECRTVYHPPPPDTLLMYLHALRYSGQGWDFSSDLPTWATL